MNCKDLEVLLSAYADGELAETHRDFIEEHLAGCSECRAALEEYKKTREKLISLREMPAMLDIREAVMSRVKLLETPAKVRR